MTTFIVRVELHDANDRDYENLHAAMAKAGFGRTVRSDDGKDYALPTAMYSAVGTWTAVQVRDAAQQAANTTRKSSWIIAIQSAALAWSLKQV